MKTTTTKSRVRRAGAVALLAALTLSGCSIVPAPATDPTRYFLLEGPSSPPTDVQPPRGSLRLGLEAVRLPPYLRNQRAIVIRSGLNEIHYEDYSRWAEPLDLAIQHAVRQGLLGSGDVAAVDTPPFPPEGRRDLRVSVQVLRCEGGVDAQGRNTAQFQAVYEIADQRQEGRGVTRHTFSPEPAEWNGTDYSQLAAKLGNAAAALGREIAANLPK